MQGVAGRWLGVRAPFLLGAVILAVVGLLALFAVNNHTIHAARIAAETASPINDA
jgi:hypothetical protein